MKNVWNRINFLWIAAALAALSLLLLVSCGTDPAGTGDESKNENGTEADTTPEGGVRLPDDCVLPGKEDAVTFDSGSFVEWNGYLIGPSDVLTGRYSPTPLKYNLSTGTLTPICVDPICTHDTKDCPLSDFTGVVGVRGDRLYITRSWVDCDPASGACETICLALASYGLTDGTLRDLWVNRFPYPSDEEQEAQGGLYRDDTQFMPATWMYGAYIIMHRYYPTCDKPVSIDDYHQWLVCVNVDTGEFTKLVDLTEERIDFTRVFCARDGRVYHLDSRKRLCELDLGTRQDRILLAPEQEDGALLLFNSFSGFIGDDFWYGEQSDDMTLFRIRRLSLSDGRVTTVVEEQRTVLDCFTVCGGAVYRLVYRGMTPDNRYRDYRIIRCDPDGSRETEVGSFEARAVFCVEPCADDQKLLISLMMSGGSLLFDVSDGDATVIRPMA